MNRRYGWKLDFHDVRDHLFTPHWFDLLKLPKTVDVRPNCPPIVDQGALGSCTASAIAGALQFDQMRQKEASFMPSRLFIYYNERAAENTVNSDAGASIRDGIKSVNVLGVPPESEWPYIIDQFTVKPTDKCYQDAMLHRSLSYQRVKQDVTHMKAALATGLPFVFGFTVYESFESAEVAQTGVVPMPQRGESVLGGHAVCAVGYDDAQQVFYVRNSWGAAWGLQGYFTMPYAYLQHLASDFWVIQTVQ